MSHARKLAAALVLALALAAPAARADVPEPDLRADAAIVVDARTGEVLHAERPEERHAIASATKLMTALLALQEADPDDVFTAPRYDALPVESKIDLRKGERMEVEDLMEALLLESANDAAVTIARGVAGSRRAFVEEMNERARELGLDDTSFANPIGLDHPDNYSTARDLAALARRLLRDELFAEIVDMPKAVLETGSHRRVVRSRNELVRRHPFVDGVKTGHTERAGWVLVGSATGRGAQVVSVVLGAPSEEARDADSLELLRYGLDQYRRVPALRAGRPLASVDVRWYDGREVALTTAEDVALTVRRGEEIETVVDAPERLEGPLREGARVGTVSLVYRGETVRTAPLVTAAAVPEAGTLRRLTAVLGVPLTFPLAAVTVLAVILLALRFRVVRRRRARA